MSKVEPASTSQETQKKPTNSEDTPNRQRLPSKTQDVLIWTSPEGVVLGTGSMLTFIDLNGTAISKTYVDEGCIQCYLCLGDYQHSDRILRMQCQHHSHTTCIANMWFIGGKYNCPKCRGQPGSLEIAANEGLLALGHIADVQTPHSTPRSVLATYATQFARRAREWASEQDRNRPWLFQAWTRTNGQILMISNTECLFYQLVLRQRISTQEQSDDLMHVIGWWLNSRSKGIALHIEHGLYRTARNQVMQRESAQSSQSKGETALSLLVHLEKVLNDWMLGIVRKFVIPGQQETAAERRWLLKLRVDAPGLDKLQLWWEHLKPVP